MAFGRGLRKPSSHSSDNCETEGNGGYLRAGVPEIGLMFEAAALVGTKLFDTDETGIAADICPQGRAGQEATQAMLITGSNRMSRIETCVRAAHHFLLTEEDAIAIANAQLVCIGDNWQTVCEEASLDRTERNLLWGRQFLNPFAFTALTGKAAALETLADEIRAGAQA